MEPVAKTHPRHRQPLSRIQVYLLVLGTLLVLNIWLLPKDLLVRNWIRSHAHHLFHLTSASVPAPQAVAQSLDELSKDDPALGTEFPTVGVGKTIRAKEKAGTAGIFLVTLSDCSSCTRFEVRRWQKDAKQQGVSFVVVSGSDPKESAAWAEGAKVDFPIYHDPELVLTKKLNGFYNGRLYWFDRDWRLRWLMGFQESDRHLHGLAQLAGLIEKEKVR